MQAPEHLPFRVSLEAVNKTVGVTAFGLPVILLAVGHGANTCSGIDTISHYYFTRFGGDIFVGSLIMIGVLMGLFYRLPTPVEGYLGHRSWDMRMVRLAGLAVCVIALIPTTGSGCEAFDGASARVFVTSVQGGNGLGLVAMTPGPGITIDIWETLGGGSRIAYLLHYIAALALFAILAWFALVVFRRPQSAAAFVEGGALAPRKTWRNRTYLVCGLVITTAVLALLVYGSFVPFISPLSETWRAWNLTFWVETAALWAFGISWAVKGRLFSFLRDPGEVHET